MLTSILGLAYFFVVSAWSVAPILAGLGGVLFSVILLLALNAKIRDWPYLRRKNRLPFIWLNANGFVLKGTGGVLWPQLKKAETVVVGHKVFRTLLVLSFGDEGPPSDFPDGERPQASEVRGLRPGDVLVDISNLESWATPATLLALMHKRMKAAAIDPVPVK